MKTLAAVLTDINQPLKIEELTIPPLKEGQVLVKVAYSGVCHSQLNEIRGLKGEDKFLPHTLGHEGAGTVQAVGSGVIKVREGESVVLTWIKGTGQDVPSSSYTRNDGSKVNSGAISTFMEYAVVSENRLVSVPHELPLRDLPLLGCAIPTGAGIAMNTAKIASGSSVAVFGVGGIGLSALIGSRLRGAKTIIAVDVFDHKLELARELGATHTIHGLNQDASLIIKEITGNAGLDYAIEASGNSEVMETAFQAVRDNGGLCVLAGNLPAGKKISIDPLDLIKGKRIVGTWGGETQPDRDIPIYLDLFQSGKLKLSSLISRTYQLTEINQALEDMANGKVARGLIEMP
jgi:S-(hydroxymethyl)glutathione dehydrogenase/alcohol dehydrogenase